MQRIPGLQNDQHYSDVKNKNSSKIQLVILLFGILLFSLACQMSDFTSTTESSEIVVEEIIPTTMAVTEAAITAEEQPTQTPWVIQGETVTTIVSEDDLLVELYKKVSPGVVSIQTISASGGSLGSGFVYDKEGHIVTNYHVVSNASELEVDFPSGVKVYGKVIATDTDSDLAVIKVDVSEDVLFPLTLGDSDLLEVGQTVVAIGNPFGLSGTMTMGIVSAKGRTLSSIRQTEAGYYYSAGDIIQTDASINPGNSGGPLLNLNGEVVGLNRAIQTTGTTSDGEPINSGIGFSISVNIIKKVVPVLIETGYYDYPYVGVSTLEELTLIEQEALGITYPTGAYITSVNAGSPADIAGLKGGTTPDSIYGIPMGGDLIIGVDGKDVMVFGDFLSYIMINKNPGDEITIKIIRNGEEMEVKLTLGKRPQ